MARNKLLTMLKGGGVSFEGNLLSNPDFETAGAGGVDIFANWVESESVGTSVIAAEATIIYNGTKACKITRGDTAVNITQTITVVPGETYRLEFFTRGDNTNDARFRVFDATNSADIVASTDTGIIGETYQYYSKEFVAPALCTSVQIVLTDGGAGSVYFDAVSVRLKR